MHVLFPSLHEQREKHLPYLPFPLKLSFPEAHSEQTQDFLMYKRETGLVCFYGLDKRVHNTFKPIPLKSLLWETRDQYKRCPRILHSLGMEAEGTYHSEWPCRGCWGYLQPDCINARWGLQRFWHNWKSHSTVTPNGSDGISVHSASSGRAWEHRYQLRWQSTKNGKIALGSLHSRTIGKRTSSRV